MAQLSGVLIFNLANNALEVPEKYHFYTLYEFRVFLLSNRFNFCFPSWFNSQEVQRFLILSIANLLKIRPSISILSFDVFLPLTLEFCFIELKKIYYD